MKEISQIKTWACVAAASSFLLPAASHAQQGLYEDERGVTAISTAGYRDNRNQTSASLTPLSFSYNYNTGDWAGASAAVSQTTSADYGALSVATSGSSQSSASYGTFTWSSTVVGGDYAVSFRDLITANQAMDIGYDFHVAGTSSFQSNVDGGTFANTQWGFAGFNSDGGELALNGVLDRTGTWHCSAGQQFWLEGGLGWNANANSNDLNGRYASYDMGSTATMTLKVLTAGATYTSASGHNYSQAVPEPGSLAAFGLGCVALLKRRGR